MEVQAQGEKKNNVKFPMITLGLIYIIYTYISLTDMVIKLLMFFVLLKIRLKE